MHLRLRLRTKLTLIMTGLVFLVVAVLSLVFLSRLMDEVLREANQRAAEFAQQMFLQAQHAISDAKAEGILPASRDPQEIHDYVRHAFEIGDGLKSELEAARGNMPYIYDVSIVDHDGVALVSSDSNDVGSFMPRQLQISALVQGNILSQMRALYGPGRVYEFDYPFVMSGHPFGEVRVGIHTAFLRDQIAPTLRTSGTIVLVALLISTGLTMVVIGTTLSPLQDIAAQLDRISAGQYDVPLPAPKGIAGGSDEFGQVSRKISQVGQHLRGVHEIFSTLRENLNSVMAGLEDGLLLFTRDARAVMVSPAAEKFLGAPAGHFLGRRVTEIFPSDHPLRQTLHFEGDELGEITSETELETPQGSRRVGVSVQVIQEDGERIGALVTLRDLDSLESINTQLQVSERLAALGRITAGVAHEVKNPLNSMRLWLENLKESLPRDGDTGARQAVQVLDSEIDRLDAVVKRFLDFTRPMEIRLEATNLAFLLRDVLAVALPQLQQANVEVSQNLIADVPEVFADRGLLRQAVLNLVLNAVDAMPNGGQLRLMLNRKGDMAEISVADTGKGIPAENQQKIFQLFFTTRPGGSGIGLASTFRIVQLHNGSIDFTSEVGRGTTFRIELPLAA
ncbi:MAG TPA: ATP-binding protein [Terriglobales bacterium]|nr:ATP-binding protein [Terriglobales bacterium]